MPWSRKLSSSPSEQAPQDYQIWGVFVWVDGGLKTPGPINLPQRDTCISNFPPMPPSCRCSKETVDRNQGHCRHAADHCIWRLDVRRSFEDLYIPVAGGRKICAFANRTKSPAKPITYPIKTGLVKIATDTSSRGSLRIS